MNPLFKKMVDEKTPMANEAILRGYAKDMVSKSHEFMDAVWRSAAVSLPKGLEYVGCEVCTPQEAYNELTRGKASSRTFDIAPSSLILYKFLFKYKGQMIEPRYQLLPFTDHEEPSIMYLAGTAYYVGMVLADNVISPTDKSVFVKLLRDRLTFERIYHNFVVDNQPDLQHVVYGRLYRSSDSNKLKAERTTKASTTILHYLFARFGFTETWKRYCGFVPIIDKVEPNGDNPYKETHVQVRSSRVAPKGYIGKTYYPSNIVLYIPKEKWDASSKNMAAAFFYIVDHFPQAIEPNFVDNTTMWIVLLGQIVFTGHYSSERLYEKISEHLSSLDKYTDTVILNKLRQEGYQIEHFYDIISLVNLNFNQWMATHQTEGVYGKTFEVFEYLLLDVVKSVFYTIFALDKRASNLIRKPQPRDLLVKEIVEIMNKLLSTGAIFRVTKGNAVVTPASCTGDNYFAKITGHLAVQKSTTGRNATRTVIDATKRITADHAEIGNLFFLSKEDPSALRHINPYLQIDPVTHKPIANKRFVALLNDVNDKLKALGE